MTDLIKGRVWPWEKADLIARLLAEETDLADCAVDRIEELERGRDELGRTLNTARYGQPNFAWSIHEMEMVDLRAKLAKAVEALRWYDDRFTARKARDVLAELEAK